jgi:hypothetical protein
MGGRGNGGGLGLERDEVSVQHEANYKAGAATGEAYCFV